MEEIREKRAVVFLELNLFVQLDFLQDLAKVAEN